MESLNEHGDSLRQRLMKVGEAFLNSHFMQVLLSRADDVSPEAFRETVQEIIENRKNKKER